LLIFSLVGLIPAAGQCGKLFQEAGLVQGLKRRKVVSKEPLHRDSLSDETSFYAKEASILKNVELRDGILPLRTG
jgi:hypothetical protein